MTSQKVIDSIGIIYTNIYIIYWGKNKLDQIIERTKYYIKVYAILYKSWPEKNIAPRHSSSMTTVLRLIAQTAGKYTTLYRT